MTVVVYIRVVVVYVDGCKLQQVVVVYMDRCEVQQVYEEMKSRLDFTESQLLVITKDIREEITDAVHELEEKVRAFASFLFATVNLSLLKHIIRCTIK